MTYDNDKAKEKAYEFTKSFSTLEDLSNVRDALDEMVYLCFKAGYRTGHADGFADATRKIEPKEQG